MLLTAIKERGGREKQKGKERSVCCFVFVCVWSQIKRSKGIASARAVGRWG